MTAAAAVVALEWFGGLTFAVVGVLAAYLTHAVLTEALIVASGSIVLEGVIMIFALIYVRDVRLRSEGADLLSELALPQLTSPSAAVDEGDRGDGLDRRDRVLIAGSSPGARTSNRPHAPRSPPKSPNASVRSCVSFSHLDDVALLEHLGRPD